MYFYSSESKKQCEVKNNGEVKRKVESTKSF